MGEPLRRFCLMSIDLLFVTSATVLAVVLRGDFEDFSSLQDKMIALIPYIFISLGSASLVFFVGGVDRTPWRYSSVADYLQIIVLTVLVILLALVLTFTVNRLDGVARSLPLLQGGLIAGILVSARSAARFWHARQLHLKGNGHVNARPRDTVLIVGVNTVSELYLTSVQEFASGQVLVAGVLAEEPKMRGRAIHQKPILGTVEELQEILQSLEVHGVAVNRIVVATAKDQLGPRALQALFEVEKSSDIIVQFLSERLGFEDSSQELSAPSGQEFNSDSGQRAVARVANVIDFDFPHSTRNSTWLGKRIVDISSATFLIIVMIPVAVFVAFVVALDLGFPLLFWQQRPGLYGRPFKLYKFRTMRAPHDRDKRRIPDGQRSSAIGQLIRRTRLDELPQLYNVLVGDMSIVGPRPLLPCDQSPDYAARLSVRPGITGWAQVNGGRIISPSDKCILDIWYAQNASLVLDLKIVLNTAKMIFFGDRINPDAVNQARSDLGLTTLLRTTMIPAE